MNRSRIKSLHQIFLDSKGVSIDSREMIKDKVFFAIKGARVDAHDFVDSVLDNGAMLAVVHEDYDSARDGIFKVKDTVLTLQSLARFHRRFLNKPVIGITGSNGKTTTKELVVSVLSQQYNMHATKGNFNSLIGVPLTILQANKAHDILVIEMGANAKGEIKQLAEIAEPDEAIITNIGPAHLEGFGDLAGVLYEKTALYRFVQNQKGLLYVPAMEKGLIEVTADYQPRMTYVSSAINDDNADLVLKVDQDTPHIVACFSSKEETFTFNSVLMGMYNGQNCAAAVSVGLRHGLSGVNIVRGIEAYSPTNNRSQRIVTERYTVILDAYNANPGSMNRALDMLNRWPSTIKVAILGDMLELGKDAEVEHQNIVNRLSKGLTDHSILIGTQFRKINKNGFANVTEAIPSVEELSNKLNDAVILIKGSRSIGLERLLPALGIDMQEVQ